MRTTNRIPLVLGLALLGAPAAFAGESASAGTKQESRPAQCRCEHDHGATDQKKVKESRQPATAEYPTFTDQG